MTIIAIPIDSASNAQLRYFAQSVLGLDVPSISNSVQLRAKIEAAAPNITEIRAPADTGVAEIVRAEVAPVMLGVGGPVSSVPEGRAGRHEKYDPKVVLTILPTSDKTRTKDVPIPVNGDLLLVQRGQKVSIPLRYFFALDNSVEMVAVELDEIDPQTSLPRKEWQEQHSYPHNVHEMPSPEEIAIWQDRMAVGELG